MSKISIIICTYNEVNFIKKTLYQIKKKIKNSEIIIVDDNSYDGTLEVLKKLKKKIKFTLIVRKNVRGLATALSEGFKRAKGQYIGTFDANTSDQINYFNKAIKKLDNGNDIAVLSRYVKGGADKRILLRTSTSFLINKLSKLILNIPFNDFTSGIFIMKKKIIKQIKIKPIGHGEWFIEFIYKIYQKRYKISEIPYIQKSDTYQGNSKTSPNIIKFALLGFKYFLAILKIKINNMK